MHNHHKEARRQIEICNACRYCEGYCAVFPSMFKQRAFSDGDITQLANLCHNCRGCYYACQYTEPHEFALNIPRALAEVRQESWQKFAWPLPFARLFYQSGVIIAALFVVALTLIFFLMSTFKPSAGEGFYAYLSHNMMVLIFIPAFLLPLLSIGISLRRYWKFTGGGNLRVRDILTAFSSAVTMKNLSGGHGEGCNFEQEDMFSHKRRIFHHLTFYGFLMCFASTSSATLMHYLFNMPAPYNFFSIPKLLGVPGGIVLCIGTLGLSWLKTKAETALGASKVWGDEMAFIVLLFGVSFTGLLLYALTGTTHVQWGLPLHLAFVLVFFLLMPYSKMVHGFYRITALLKNAAQDRAQI